MLNKTLPRRTFLRGLGTAMALPVLEAMMPSSVLAATTAAKAAPVRMAFLFVPNGVHMPDWRPIGVGADWKLPYILEPLAGLEKKLTLFTGLSQHNGFALGDGPGDHARSTATYLTGVHPKKTDGADIRCGVSVDQYAAQHLANATRFPSLEIGCERGAQAGNCDSGYSCAYSSTISWRSETQPVPKEVDPRAVFERLFGTGDSEGQESFARRQAYRKSILDFVMEDAAALKAQLGVRDQRKLDEYFTGVREMEQRIQAAEKHWAEVKPPAGATKPSGVPADYAEHLRLMADMLVLAFQTDLTRVGTFMLANDGSNRPYRNIDIPEGHHDLSHHGGDPEKHAKIRKINRFHIEQVAYMLKKMDSIQEANGTLLDNSMVLYGAGISDGNRHNHDDLPIMLAGRGGGSVKSGQHHKFEKETPLNDLFLSMLDRMKIPAEKLGDSDGRIELG